MTFGVRFSGELGAMLAKASTEANLEHHVDLGKDREAVDIADAPIIPSPTRRHSLECEGRISRRHRRRLPDRRSSRDHVRPHRRYERDCARYAPRRQADPAPTDIDADVIEVYAKRPRGGPSDSSGSHPSPSRVAPLSLIDF